MAASDSVAQGLRVLRRSCFGCLGALYVEDSFAAARDLDAPHDPRLVAARLLRMLLDAEGIEEFLADVAVLAAGTIPAAVACGVTVPATHRSRMLGAASDDVARGLEEIQYEQDDGPCLTAMRGGVVVIVEDVTVERRWPAFARRGRETGIGASMSVPLLVSGRSVGALNLYARRPGSLSGADRERAQQFAEQAAGAVALAIRMNDRETHARHLETALSSRSLIDQAIGVIMAQARIDADAAFDVLRVRSQRTNTKLREVAAQIIAEAVGTGFGDQ